MLVSGGDPSSGGVGAETVPDLVDIFAVIAAFGGTDFALAAVLLVVFVAVVLFVAIILLFFLASVVIGLTVVVGAGSDIFWVERVVGFSAIVTAIELKISGIAAVPKVVEVGVVGCACFEETVFVKVESTGLRDLKTPSRRASKASLLSVGFFVARLSASKACCSINSWIFFSFRRTSSSL